MAENETHWLAEERTESETTSNTHTHSNEDEKEVISHKFNFT